MSFTTKFCTIPGMNATDIGVNIAKFREDKGLSQSDLARALGVSPQAVQKWESGSSGPKPSRLKDIAGILTLPINDLVKGTVYEYVAGNHDVSVIRDEKATHHVLPKTYDKKGEPERFWGKVPLITWEQAAMWGKLMTAFPEDDALDWVEVPNAVKGAFCLRVEDESAVGPIGQKSYSPGDLVVVDPQREPKNRSTVVVALRPGAKPVLRQLLRDGDRTLFKIINPDWPNPSRFTEWDEEVAVIGTVTGKWVPEE